MRFCGPQVWNTIDKSLEAILLYFPSGKNLKILIISYFHLPLYIFLYMYELKIQNVVIFLLLLSYIFVFFVIFLSEHMIPDFLCKFSSSPATCGQIQKSIISPVAPNMDRADVTQHKMTMRAGSKLSALRAEISCVPTKSIFRGDTRGLCSQGRQKINQQ